MPIGYVIACHVLLLCNTFHLLYITVLHILDIFCVIVELFAINRVI